MKILLMSICLMAFIFNGKSQAVDAVLFADGFSQPLAIENAGDDRLFVVEREGVIKILNADGTTEPIPFLDITAQVATTGEGGLSSVAFHPDYLTNGYFYVHYTDLNSDSQVSRFSVDSGDPNLADPASEFSILELEQPFAEHNIGTLKFGPNGLLYVGSGDGGSGGDPGNRAQDLQTLFGKLLRIDVDNPDGGNNYGIPADNPFVGDPNAFDEIWAYGLRNPWKFSIDIDDNTIWIGDVGQGEIEEVNKQDLDTGGINYGWRCYEGNQQFNTQGCPPASEIAFPYHQYSSGPGATDCAVTGGYVYRGSLYPNFQGLYFYADFCSASVRSLDDIGFLIDHGSFSNTLVSFGEDVNRELYLISISTGRIFQITDVDLSTPEFDLQQIKLAPNPASDIVILSIENDLLDSIEIFDVNGRRIYKETELLVSEKTITTSTYSEGLYLVKAITQTGKSEVKKLVIQ